MNIDIEAFSDADLSRLHESVLRELEVRNAKAEIVRNLETIQNHAGTTIVDGRPWTQPTDAHDAYPLGSTVVDDGHLWESAHPFNVWEPGTGDLWIDRGEASEPDPLPLDDYPAWAPNISVSVGDVYSYNGAAYSAVQAHTTQAGWEPPAVPALWKKVG